MDCLLPGASNLDAYAAQTRSGAPAVRAVAPDRWPFDPQGALAAAIGDPDRVTTVVGGFVDDVPWDAAGLDLGDFPIDAVDPLFRHTLHVCRGALADTAVARDRTDLLLANLSLPSSGAVRLVGQRYAAHLRAVPWLGGGHPQDAWHSAGPALLARRALGLGGHASALDAACASGLYAVRLACDRLAAGLCDAAIAAGVQRADSAYLFLGFSQLRALSRSGVPRPFDRRADGLVVGEGAAAVLIKRLDDAMRAGDRIHAVIRGGGLGNDGRKGNLLAPDGAGQLRALRAAYARAGVDPARVDYVECHATGTPVGDRTEVEALRALRADAPAVLGSSKGVLGHTITVAGLAGLIRATLAVRDGFLPPAPACEDPLPALGPLRVLSEAAPWDAAVRRAGVSAFGFGGTNAHVVVEQHTGDLGPAAAPPTPPLAVVGLAARVGAASDTATTLDALLGGHPLLGPGADRLGRQATGAWLADTSADSARLRTPPTELGEVLPQQVLAVHTALEALSGLGLDPGRVGSVIGMGIDPQVAEAALRLVARDPDAVGPPLTAGRVQGTLPNLVANRIAALADLQGPSYTVSAGEASGLVALEHAGRLLAHDDLDAVVVGASDASGAWGFDAGIAGDGAFALVVRRLADAERDGQAVLAVLAPSPAALVVAPPEVVVDAEAARAATRGVTGHLGAADGLAGVVLAVAALHERAFPPLVGPAAGGWHPRRARAWLRDDAEPARTARVDAPTPFGFTASVALSEHVGTPPSLRASAVSRPAVTCVRAPSAAALAEAIDRARAELGAPPPHVVPADAHRWLAARPAAPTGYTVAIVAACPADLDAGLARAAAALRSGTPRLSDGGVYLGPPRDPGRVAFVYPGAGSAWPHMHRALLAAFPDLVHALERTTDRLRTHLCEAMIDPRGAEDDADLDVLRDAPLLLIWTSAWLSKLQTEVLGRMGLRPDAAIGCSLGENAAMAALGYWDDVDALLKRFVTSRMYTTLLAGPMDAVRKAWKEQGIHFDPSASPVFTAWTVKAPRAAVEAACATEPGVHVLIVHHDDEVVVGGPGAAVGRVLDRVGGERTPSPFQAAVHCPEVEAERDEYVALHVFPTNTVPGITMYSGATGEPYEVTAQSAAEHIATGACTTVDMPKVVRRAWDDGVRTFVEVGPRGACTRWIEAILADREHVAVQTDRAGHDGVVELAHAVARLLVAGVNLDPTPLAGPVRHRPVATGPVVRIPRERPALRARWTGAWGGDTVPVPVPGAAPLPVAALDAAGPGTQPLTWAAWVGLPAAPPAPVAAAPTPAPPAPTRARAPAARPTLAPTAQAPARPSPGALGTAELAQALSRSSLALAAAHEAFLASRAQATAQLAQIASLVGALGEVPRPTPPRPAPRPAPPRVPDALPATFDRAALERFAVGPISEVLGREYADLDAIEPRVRLPKAPLLLVSRVTEVEGRRGALGPSRLVTEYDLPVDAEWAHDGKPPPCVVVESGQADLFLCAILGTDAVCRGESLYRLLDCDLTFHGDRPPVGVTLRHDIRIKRFAKLGGKLLFYFEYDCTTGGVPVLTMRDGVAGFFTPAELARPQGVDPAPRAHPRREPLAPPIAGAPSSLHEAATRALAASRPSQAFGAAFAPADGSTLRLPPSRWGLLARVPHLALSGGPHGLGGVIAEQDLRDDDWFNPVHFHGDPCMPGTLMLDGCFQALEVWLLAHGFGANYPDATFEPVAGRTARLRCRGQVVPGHARLTYDVRVTDAGTTPTPWAVADVLLLVDGTPVVRAEDVAVRIAGVARATVTAPREARPPAEVSEALLLEHAVGAPSRAFGPAFAPFDGDRRTPRIPGPPLLLMHGARPASPRGEKVEGATVSVDYTVPTDAWFAGQGVVPLVAQLELALQPCGWFTAWQGTALRAPGETYFRNLGGSLVQRGVIRPGARLTTTATLTSVSSSGGMILTFFDLDVRAGDAVVLSGDTHFGYFDAAALGAQKGLVPSTAGSIDAWRASADPTRRPVTTPRDDLRMVDAVIAWAPEGGSAGLGWVEAEQAVDPGAWFYTAHFHQDPVMPGSLGLEALAQLAAWVLRERGVTGPIGPIPSATPQKWRYRGQVPPTRERLTYQLDVRALGSDHVVAHGVVIADGLPIYEVDGLTVGVVPPPAPVAPALRRADAALLDRVHVDGDRLTGVLRLDPTAHPWLRDHAPTLVIPALPMAFAAEIAAEAAGFLRPGQTVVEVPEIVADKWIHTADGPVDLLVVAVAEGDTVAVSLAVHHDNPKFPRLSGPVVHMRAIARVGGGWCAAPAPLPPLHGAPCDQTVRDYYDGGYTFHGPVLQGMVSLDRLGPDGATATFATRPDADLLPPGSPPFVLDPLLLDTATHPMRSGTPEVWVPGLPHGRLAYPVRCDAMRFHGPRPEGRVTCRLDRVSADARHLCFDVRLDGATGPWVTFRWTEALVDGGPLLGRHPDEIRAFCKERRPVDVRIGVAAGGRWRVTADDLVEPIPGTLARLLCHPTELAERTGPTWDLARFAAKEAARSWLRARLGRDVHPATLRLCAMRPDRYVVTDATTLTAQELVDHLGPTRFDLSVSTADGFAEAWVTPR